MTNDVLLQLVLSITVVTVHDQRGQQLAVRLWLLDAAARLSLGNLWCAEYHVSMFGLCLSYGLGIV